MKAIIKIIVIVLSFVWALDAEAQINMDAFIQNLEKRAIILDRHKKSDIKSFMKYGYKERSYLRCDSIKKVPIYKIYNKKKLFHFGMTPDSLFVYLNPKCIALDQVYFYRGDSCINIGYPKYYKIKEQAIGVCYNGKKLIALSIIDRTPKLVFSWADDDVYFFLNQDSTLTCFLMNSSRTSYQTLTPQEMISVLKARWVSDPADFFWMNNEFKPQPPILCK